MGHQNHSSLSYLFGEPSRLAPCPTGPVSRAKLPVELKHQVFTHLDLKSVQSLVRVKSSSIMGAMVGEVNNRRVVRLTLG